MQRLTSMCIRAYSPIRPQRSSRNIIRTSLTSIWNRQKSRRGCQVPNNLWLMCQRLSRMNSSSKTTRCRILTYRSKLSKTNNLMRVRGLETANALECLLSRTWAQSILRESPKANCQTRTQARRPTSTEASSQQPGTLGTDWLSLRSTLRRWQRSDQSLCCAVRR